MKKTNKFKIQIDCTDHNLKKFKTKELKRPY